MNNVSLVVLAAGMGNRFGGLKQLTGVGPNGETLLEYGVYDAFQSGVRKVIFIVRRSFETEFRQVVVNRFADYMEVECVYQEINDLPSSFFPPSERKRPWGTGHALLSARDALDGPFIVINGDDFYGRSAYAEIVDFLRGDVSDENGLRLALGGYRLRNTLSQHGTVSRGICEVDGRTYLHSLTEHRKLRWNKTGDAVHSEEQGIDLSGEELVSLNLFGLQHQILAHLESDFCEFLSLNNKSLDAEFFLPEVVSRLVSNGEATLRVLPTDEHWFGMTYAEETEKVRQAISERIKKGIYPERLWSV